MKRLGLQKIFLAMYFSLNKTSTHTACCHYYYRERLKSHLAQICSFRRTDAKAAPAQNIYIYIANQNTNNYKPIFHIYLQHPEL